MTSTTSPKLPAIDWPLISMFSILLLLGFLMVFSTSVAISEAQQSDAFYYVKRQGLFFLLGLVSLFIAYFLPLTFWFKMAPYFLMATMLLMIVVLFPGIGHEVNGARRWILIGPFQVQVVEVAKLSSVLYFAGYLARHRKAIETGVGFMRPMIVIALLACLSLLQPDFGGALVILVTALGIAFLAGAPWRYFLGLTVFMAATLVVLTLLAPYRMQRLTSFMDPWQDQFNTGYQLTQALMAFGRGGWFGAGLGGSVQKLFYLPEAHTDFVFAVFAEEFGLFGCVLLMGLFAYFVFHIFKIGRRQWMERQYFKAYLAYGIGIWFFLQIFISMGVNVGLLPTKGLTLPFISYGGSSLLISMIAMGLLFNISHKRGAL